MKQTNYDSETSSYIVRLEGITLLKIKSVRMSVTILTLSCQFWAIDFFLTFWPTKIVGLQFTTSSHYLVSIFYLLLYLFFLNEN